MKSVSRLCVVSLIIGILVLVGGFFLDLAQPTSASEQPSTDISLGVDSSQGVVINFYYDSQEQLNAVAGELDIWEVHPLPGIGPGSGYAVAAVIPAQQDWLQVLGYRVEIDQEKTTLLQSPASVLDPRYYYFDNYFNNPNNLYIVNFLQETNTAYPTLTELYDIGDAWQASNGGYHRDMWVMRITNEDAAYGDITTKPPFFLFANIHAREVTTPEMTIRYIKYLTTGYNGLGGYGIDADVTWLVNHHVVYLLVSQNPDGRVINEQDISNYRRKNMDNNDGCTTPSLWGVDLNRNHTFLWGCCGGSSGNPCSETYRGPTRGSEPETDAFQVFATFVLNDWNGPNGDDTIPPASPANTPGIFISLHSYADEILWPWGFSGYGDPPNIAQLTTIGRKLADFTYDTMTPSGGIGYDVDGATDDWVYGKLGVAAYTYEIGPNYGSCGDFFPQYGCQDGIDGMTRNFWREMRESFIYAHKIAVSPYITAYGPDAQNLIVTPSFVPSGQPVDLTGLVLDQRYLSDPLQPIAAAEYFIDAPGTDGTGLTLSPTDGAWGETSEEVNAVVDTTGLALGQHYVLVHGMNDDGVWGPFTAVFITIDEPAAPTADFSSNSPVLIGDPVIFENLTTGSEPITYTWDFGDGNTSSEFEPSHLYLDLGTYTVMLEATNYLGSDSVIHPVTVEPIAITSVDLTKVTPDPVYTGDSVEFSADLLPDEATQPYTYTVQYGDGTIFDGSSSEDPLLLNHIYMASSDYTITIEVWNIGMSVPVTDSLNLPVLAPIPPVAEFTSNSPVHIGQPVQFTNQSDGSPTPTYLWNFGDGGTSTETNPAHLYADIGTYTVTLLATNRFGDDIVSHPVAVVPIDITSVDLTRITPGIIYAGEPVNFSADLLPNDATKPYTYTIDYGDGLLDDNASDLDPLPLAHVYSNGGTYTLVIEVLNVGMTVPVTDSLDLEVIEPVTITSIDLTLDSPMPIYAGDPVQFSADLAPEDATKPYTYTILYGDGISTTNTSSNDPLAFEHVYATGGNFTVQIAVLNDVMTVPVTDSLDLVVLIPDPMAKFSSNSPVLLGQPVQFTNQSIGLEPITYEWDFGDGSGTSTETNPSYIYVAIGTFTVTLEATNALGSDSVIHQVTVEPIAITTVELAQLSSGPIFVGDTVEFSADLSPDTATKPYTYTIDYGDGTLLSLTSSDDPLLLSHSYTSGGNYTISIEVWNEAMVDPATDTLAVTVMYRSFLPLTSK